MNGVEDLARDLLRAAWKYCDDADDGWQPPGYQGLPAAMRFEVEDTAHKIIEGDVS